MQRISGDQTVDLNTFTFFYKDKPAITHLLSRDFDPCTKVCELRSWPDREEVYEGTLFEGDSGPEGTVAEFGFFVVRPFITQAEALACQTLEVMHVRTEWLNGEHGASWFFHTVGSACTQLPTTPHTRQHWRSPQPSGVARKAQPVGLGGRWGHKILERMERDGHAMLIFLEADFTVFNQEGNNPSTEIVVRHKNRRADDGLRHTTQVVSQRRRYRYHISDRIESASVPCKWQGFWDDVGKHELRSFVNAGG